MSSLRRAMCVFFVVLAPAAALAQSDVPEVRTEIVDLEGATVTGSLRDTPGVVLANYRNADFDSLVRVERSFLSEIRDAAHAPSMQ